MKIGFLIILSTILLFRESGLEAQFYNAGSDPGTIKWKQIKTKNFTILFPAECNTIAQNYANHLENTYLVNTWGINSKPKPLKIVIHNQNVLSNGFVMWAPRRMEIISTPPQDNYAHDWLEQLALHEYRHVLQVSKLNQGFTKIMTYLTGDIAMGAEVGYFPLWFIEGDAVLTETVLSSTGRGRDATFDKGVRAIELQDSKRYSYDQAYLGSYRSSLPNHYNYGYQLVTWATYKFGNQCWEKAYSNVAKKPFIIAPFYFGLKKTIGLSKVGLYNQALDSIGNGWKKEQFSVRISQSEAIPVSYKSNFVSYRFPYQLRDSGIIALRSSIDDLTRLVLIKDGQEKILYTMGNFYGSQLAYSPEYVAWEEIQYDPRWEQRTYSVIKILDINKRTTTILKSKERHFSPAINYSGDLLAVNKIDPLNNSWLEIYDIETKQLINRCLHPLKEQVTFCSWIDNESIALVSLGTKGKSIYVYDINSQSWELVVGPTCNNITGIHSSQSDVYFTWQSEGKSNIFVLNLKSKKIFQVTNMQVGSEFPALTYNKKSLLFSEYTSGGYKLQTMNLSNSLLIDADSLRPHSYTMAEDISRRVEFNIQDSVFAYKQFESRPYSNLLHSFNFHSWLLPVYFDSDNFEMSQGLNGVTNNLHPGILLLSQNVLSNVTSTLGYYFSDGYHYFKPAIYLRTFYPVFSFVCSAGGPAFLESTGFTLDSIPDKLDNGYIANIGISIPLTMSSSRFSLYFTPKAEIILQNRYIADSIYYPEGDYDFIENNIYYYQGKFALDYNAFFYAASKMAYKDLKPRWSVNCYFSSYQPQINKQYFKENNLVSLSFTFPGFYRHHAFGLTVQVEDGPGLRLELPRGYEKVDYRGIYNKKQVSINYTFPLIYPDFSVGPVFYLKRIHTNLFYDAAEYKTNLWQNHEWVSITGNLQSAGAELGFETHFLRFFMPVVPVIRYNHLISTQKNTWAFYIATNYSFSLGQLGNEGKNQNNRN